VVRALPVVLATLILTPGHGRANGNHSHVWAAVDAIGTVDGEDLRALVEDPGLREVIRNGAMFPDGGYAVGDGYGELSHWEPLHLAYADWIREAFPQPWSDEARRHVAFLLGMVAHGVSDQLYDGMYLERAAFHDGVGPVSALGGVDGLTDACFAAAMGPMAPPDPWVPAEALAPLYEPLGHHVEPATLTQGQSLVGVAILVADDRAASPDTMAQFMAERPWACSHQDDPEVAGSPVTHGPVIARAWAVLWDRLHGREDPGRPLLGTFFTRAAPFDQALDATSPDSWVSFMMPRGLDTGTVTGETVTVRTTAGAAHPVSVKVYYGQHSHLVNLRPKQDWAADTEYTVTVGPGLSSWDGTPLGPSRSFTFATFPEPPVPPEDVVEGAGDVSPPGPEQEPVAELPWGCAQGAAAGPSSVALLLAAALLLLHPRRVRVRNR